MSESSHFYVRLSFSREDVDHLPPWPSLFAVLSPCRPSQSSRAVPDLGLYNALLIHAAGTMPSNGDIFQIFKCLHIHQVLALIGFKAFKVPYPCLMGVPVGNHRCSVPIIETAR